MNSHVPIMFCPSLCLLTPAFLSCCMLFASCIPMWLLVWAWQNKSSVLVALLHRAHTFGLHLLYNFDDCLIWPRGGLRISLGLPWDFHILAKRKNICERIKISWTWSWYNSAIRFSIRMNYSELDFFSLALDILHPSSESVETRQHSPLREKFFTTSASDWHNAIATSLSTKRWVILIF